MKKIILLSVLVQTLSLTSYSSENAKYTISGVSSGGFMANQMSTIFSSHFSGVASVAGGYYFCAENYLQTRIKADAFTIGSNNLFLYAPTPKFFTTVVNPFLVFSDNNNGSWFAPSVRNPTYQAVTVCMGGDAKVESSLNHIASNAEKGLIDHPSFLSNQKAFIYHGIGDQVLNFKMSETLKSYYAAMGLKEENIKTMSGEGNHNFPTDLKDQLPCNETDVPYLASCELNLSEKILQFLIGGELQFAEPKKDNIYIVDQTLNLENVAKEPQEWSRPAQSVAPYGYLYASDKCLNNPQSCRLHIALHGCAMSDSYDQDFQSKYKSQVMRYRKLTMNSKSSDAVYVPILSNPIFEALTIEERTLKFGLLKFVLDSGYSKFAEKNNLMILFPQTWITEANYPYNPTGCWDWYGWTGEDYATNKGSEPQWLMSFIRSIAARPKMHIINKRPNFEEAEANFKK